MRAAFGLVSVLICVFIMIYVFTIYTHQTTPAMVNVTKQANQIAGRSSNGVGVGQQGTPVLADSKFTPVEQNGKLAGMTVVVMPPTNGLAEYFGLAVGDVITGIGPFKMGEDTLSDEESARNWIQEGMQRQMTMNVLRGGQPITLPADRNTPVPAVATPASASQTNAPAIDAQSLLQGSTLVPLTGSGRLIGLKVSQITQTNPLAQFYGLASGDVIYGIGPLKMGEQNLDNESAALTHLQTAYQTHLPVLVDRNGDHLTLPLGVSHAPNVTNSRGAAENLRDAINRQQNPGE